MSTSAGPCLFSYYCRALGYHYALVPLAVSVGHVQTICYIPKNIMNFGGDLIVGIAKKGEEKVHK